MIFEIRKVKNGILLKVSDAGMEESDIKEIVYQEKYDEEDEIECFRDFLWLLNEHYGPSTSRYSPKRIHITIEPGDKFGD
ncbi:MAG: hypothetical protein Q7T03_03685 [Deltaproteobacteria bacterium]|nr:hypothetical protein [Deltaproteobacteria bacterium]